MGKIIELYRDVVCLDTHIPHYIHSIMYGFGEGSIGSDPMIVVISELKTQFREEEKHNT